MGQFRYTLDSGEKFECPSCGASKRFVRYKDNVRGNYVDGEYGKCDRVNSCGHWVQIKNKYVNADMLHQDVVPGRERSILMSDTFEFEFYESYYLNRNISRIGNETRNTNVFLRGLAKRFGIENVIRIHKEMRIGTFYDGGTIFPFFNTRDELITGKIMFYDKNLKRIRSGRRSYPMWFHNYDYKAEDGYYYAGGIQEQHITDIPFFNYKFRAYVSGEIDTVCLVESEKTAVIMSIVLPDYHWIASGGLCNLQEYKFFGMNSLNWVLFPDLGYIKNKNNTSVRDYWENRFDQLSKKFDFKSLSFPEYIPPNANDRDVSSWLDKGYDVADFVLKDPGYSDYIKGVMDSTVKRTD